METDSDEDANVCPICLRSFSTLAGVRTHWRVHSADEIQTAINRNTQSQAAASSIQNVTSQAATIAADDFRCFECGFDTGNEPNYILHIRSHLSSSSNIVGNATASQLSTSNQEFIQYVAKLKQSYRLVKRIPKGARNLVAKDFSRLVDKCISSNDAADWRSLFLFAFKALRLPDKSDDISLVQIIKRNLSDSENLPIIDRKRSNKQSSLAGRVEAKLADFDISGAVRLISSTDTLAMDTDETFDELVKKHPQPSRTLHFSNDAVDSIQPLQVDSDMVQSSIRSFANGSSAGGDGLRPQHLKDLISLSAGEGGKRALDSITKLVNLFLAGQLNVDVCELIYGASLCALEKKTGGIRPIAIGSTLRRLTSKIACFSVKSDMVNYLLPRQIGFGVRFGCEGAVHAIRSYIRNPKNGLKLIIKVDIKNAFNSVERDVMLAEIKKKIPQLYHYFRQCYLKPTFLTFGNKIILSRVGAQQGDPAGPLIFSLAIHPLIVALRAELNLWYLDDGTLGDSPDKLLADLELIKTTAKSIGLELNSEKCELYFCNGSRDVDIIRQFEALAPGIRVIDDTDLEILGSPLLENGMESYARRKFEKIILLVNRLSSLQSHYAYFILKNCLAIPKLVYLFRSSPLWKFPDLLLEMDMQLRAALEKILNIELNYQQWTQSSLPVNFGGLEIRSFLEISLPAFISSVNGVKDIISITTNIQDIESEVPFYAEALTKWEEFNGDQMPENPSSQFTWDQINIKRVISELSFATPTEQFRFELLQNKMSGAWLNVVPSPNIGTFLTNDVMRVCISLRLGLKICHPFTCICGASVDSLGRHGLHCKKNPGKYFRHADLNGILHQGLASIDSNSLLEPTGLFRDDGNKRPDGITYTAWEKGRALVWDVTCADSLAASNMIGTKRPGMASVKAASRKHSKYSKIKTSYHFVAVAVESFGPWSKEAVNLLNKIGANLIRKTGEPKARYYLFQRFSLAIQRGNAMCVISSIPKSTKLDEVHLLQ